MSPKQDAAHAGRALRIALFDTPSINDSARRMFNLEVIAGDIVGHLGEAESGSFETYRGIRRFKGSTLELYFVLLDHGDTSPAVLSLWDDIKPDITGVAMKINTLGNTRPVLRHVLQNRGIAVCGNSHSEFAFQEMLDEFPDAIMVTNEGEPAMRGIIDAVRFLGSQTPEAHPIDTTELKALLAERAIPNLAFRQSDRTYVANQERFDLRNAHPPLRDPDALSQSARLHEVVDFEFNRGCSHSRCSFCAMAKRRNSCRDGNHHYHRPVDQVIGDLRRAYACGARVFNCLSEDFIPDSDEPEELKAVDEFIEALIALRREGIVLKLFITARTRAVFVEGDEQGNAARIRRFERLKEAGCILVYLGIESGNDQQLMKRFNKDSSVYENTQALAILDGLGFTVCEGMVMFDPLMEDPRELLMNVAFMRSLESMNTPHQRANVLSRCRVQAHSFLLQRIRNVERDRQIVLLGPLDLDRLEYPVVTFLNPLIYRLFQQTQAWHTQGDTLMRRIRDLFRKCHAAEETASMSPGKEGGSSLEELQSCMRAVLPYFKGLRRLEMDLLDESAQAILSRPDDAAEELLPDIMTRYSAIRFGLIVTLERQIESLPVRSEAERVSAAIHGLLTLCPNELAEAQGVDPARVASYAIGEAHE